MQQIDLGIIIALKEEFKIFRSEFEGLRHERDASSGRYYYFFEWPQGADRYKCAASFIGDMGPDAAAMAAQDFLKTWKPPAIAMLGIAGGIHEDVGIGDVIFADQVDAYSGSGKIIDENGQIDIQFAGEVFRFPFDLIQDIDNIEFAYAEEFEQWRNDCRSGLERLLSPEKIGALIQDNILNDVLKLQKGHIASGPYVVVSEKFKNKLKSRDRSIKVVEMEAAGIMKAVYQQVDVPHAIILRGISDHGNADKKKFDGIGKGALRQYAMGNTIRLLKTLMQLNLLPKKRTSIKQNPNIRISTANLPTSEKELFGRQSELNLMDQAWNDTKTNILSVVAFGGVGKTALVNHWLNRMDINAYDRAIRI